MVKIPLSKLFKKKTFRDYVAVVFGTGIGRGLSFLTFILLARWLDVDSFGVFSLFFTIMMLVWQFSGILEDAYVRYVRVEPNNKARDYLATVLIAKIIIFILSIFFAYPLSIFLSRVIFNKPSLCLYFAMAIVAGACFSLLSLLARKYQAQSRFGMFSLLNNVFYVMVFIILWLLFLCWGHVDLPAAIWVYLSFSIVIGVVGSIVLYKEAKPLLPVQFSLLANILHFSKWLLVSNLVYVIFQRLDLFMIARFMRMEDVGIYSAAVRLSMVANLFTSGISAVFMPRGCDALKTEKRLRSYFKEALLISSFLGFGILLLAIFSEPVIRILFGTPYIKAAIPASILLLEAFFVVFYTPFSLLFYADNNTRSVFYISLLRLVVVSGALAILVPKYGPPGAAASLSISGLAALFAVIYLSHKIIKKYNYHLLPG